VNSRYLHRLRGAAVFCCLIAPLTGFAHEPVETVDSRLASPTEIHVQVTGQGVEVKGNLNARAQKPKSSRPCGRGIA